MTTTTDKRAEADRHLGDIVHAVTDGGPWMLSLMRFLVMVAEELWGPSDAIKFEEDDR